MKIVVHDYVGHPFQVHLSRQLAMRGHDVTHVYYADNPGPKGSFTRREDDPSALSFIGLTIGKAVSQTALVARRFNDVAYGRAAAKIIELVEPDVVISGNTPTEAQHAIIKACKVRAIRFVFWVQDVYGVAVSKLLTRKLEIIGKAIGWYFQALEHRQYRQSDAIVLITEGFVPSVAPWCGSAKVSVIENWAAIEDIPLGIKDNSWARSHYLHRDFIFLYSGTLGRKHNPSLLLKLAQLCHTGESVVIVAQGVGMEHLKTLANRPQTLKLLPLQPVEEFANVLATADVLVATIERDAGQFAVPSKIQSYLCAGRPILLAAPENNLAAQTVIRANAGLVVDPTDEAGFIAAAMLLSTDSALRARLGSNGRAYAERTFDMQRITDQFERVLSERATVCAVSDDRHA